MKKYPNEKNYLYNVGKAVLHAASEFIKAVEKSKFVEHSKANQKYKSLISKKNENKT